MQIAGIALRDVVLVISGLAGAYLVAMALRLWQVARRKRAEHEDELLTHSPFDDEPDFDAEAAEPGSGDDPNAAADVYERPRTPSIAYTRPPPAAAPFGVELDRSHRDMDLRQLRDEVARLHNELGALRGEVAELKAARAVSPQYADAMALAQRGLTAQDLADRCGISLGEAELVWALSRGATNFDQEEDYDGDSGYKHARSA